MIKQSGRGQSLLLMHYGYCGIQGFSIPRPSWLLQWSEFLFSGIQYDSPPATLFASLDRDEDKVADDSILAAGPQVAFWWTSKTFTKDMVITEPEIRRHFQKWLARVGYVLPS